MYTIARIQNIFGFFLVIFICGGRTIGQETANKLPRYAPFCIDADPAKENLIQGGAERFKMIIDYHNTASNKPIPVFDVAQKSTLFIQKIRVTRINVDDNLVPKSNGMSSLHNWLHLNILAESSSTQDGLDGLYIQAIKDPLGIPFGTFVTDFKCKDDSNESKNNDKGRLVVPCKARPKSAARHPYVYIYTEAGRRDKEFDVHFNWIDGPCDDAPLFQFLIVAVNKWGTSIDTTQYAIMYSPAYNNVIADAWTGVPWPLDPTWGDGKTLTCHTSSEEMLKHVEKPRFIIGINSEYDNCVLNNAMKVNYKCPPGPYLCSNFTENKDDWLEKRKLQYSNALTVTKPCIIPKLPSSKSKTIQVVISVTLKGRKTEEKQEDSSIQRAKNEKQLEGILKDLKTTLLEGRILEFHDIYTHDAKYIAQLIVKYHAILMVLCWSTLSSLSCYITRFHKETSKIARGSGCFGLGAWLWGHITYTYLCLATMWAAIFLTMFIQCDFCTVLHGQADPLVPHELSGDSFVEWHITEESHDINNVPLHSCQSKQLMHQALGVMGIIFFHCNYILGWWRPHEYCSRIVYIGIHVIIGYGSKFIALIAAFSSSVPMSVLSWVLIAEALNLCMYVAASALQYYIDSHMDPPIEPPRNYWPVPEGIYTPQNSPVGCGRQFLLAIQYLIQIGIFAGFCVAYHNRTIVSIHTTT